VCSALLGDLIAELNLDSVKREVDQGDSFNCPYCGKSFAEEKLLRAHERMEAIEFEKEAQKFKEPGKSLEDGEYITLDDVLGDQNEQRDLEDNDLHSEDEYDEEDEEEEDFYDAEYYLAEPIRILRSEDERGEEQEPVKRPLNPFMVWLQEERKKLAGSLSTSPKETGQLVRELAGVWRNLSDEDKMPYIEEARRLKEIHQQEHPDYRYQPLRKLYGLGDHQAPSAQLSKRSLLVKNYVCKRCQVGFTTKGNLFKHLRNFHPENPYDSQYYELPKDKKGGERSMKRCERCSAEFLSNVGLARHMQQAHQGLGPRKNLMYGSQAERTKAPVLARHGGLPGRPALVARRSEFLEPVSSSSDRFYFPDEDSQDKRAHVKTRFTAHQRLVLMESFQRSLTMSKFDAKQLYFTLSERLSLPVKIVRIWFQNARSARKRGKPIFSR
jgi:hypothetical protein